MQITTLFGNIAKIQLNKLCGLENHSHLQRAAMAISFLRVTVNPWWVTPLITSPGFNKPNNFKLLKLSIHRFSTSPCSAVAVADDATTAPVGPAETVLKWEALRKKKVVMRVGYVGSDYRGFCSCYTHICVCCVLFFSFSVSFFLCRTLFSAPCCIAIFGLMGGFLMCGRFANSERST